MASLARQRSQRFHWQKLVSAYTPKDFIMNMENMEKEISAKRQLARSIPTEVPKIDWASWQNQIMAPGVVDALQKEYESIVFRDQSLSQFDALKEENDKICAQALAELGSVKYEMEAADKALKNVTAMKDNAFEWKVAQWEEKIPGLKDQYAEKFENEDYLPAEEEVRIAQLDFAEIQKDFNNGTLEVIKIPQVGDLSDAEEHEVIKAGEWSIERLWAGKEQRSSLQEKIRKLKKV